MNKVTVINFAKNAIESFGNILSNNNNKYIPWGDDNMFPNILVNLYETVPEHSAALDFIEGLIVGNGLNQTDDINFWLLKQLVSDYMMYGGYAVDVVKLRNGNVKYEYIDIHNLRYNQDGSKILFSKNWGEYRSKIVTHDISDGTDSGIFIFKNNKSKKLYPKPYYLSNFLSLDTLSKIIKYHNNNATNGFSPNVLINVKGVNDDEVKDEIEKKLADKFTGDGQKFILSFSNTNEDATTISTIGTSNLDEKFKDLQLFLRDEIIIGHKITSPNLIGVNNSGNGFNKVEYEESLAIFKENVIKSFRMELEYSFSLLTKKDDIIFIDE